MAITALHPSLNFHGHCEKAFDHDARVLGDPMPMGETLRAPCFGMGEHRVGTPRMVNCGREG